MDQSGSGLASVHYSSEHPRASNYVLIIVALVSSHGRPLLYVVTIFVGSIFTMYADSLSTHLSNRLALKHEPVCYLL